MLNHREHKMTRKKDKYRERFNAKEKQMQIYHRAHGGHGGKNLSQRIYAWKPHKIH